MTYHFVVALECNEDIEDNEMYSFTADNPTSLVNLSIPTFSTKVQPNPFAQQLTVYYNTQSQSIVNVSVVNSIGQVVYRNVLTLEAGANVLPLNLGNLPDGMYFVYSVDLASHYSESQKVLKLE